MKKGFEETVVSLLTRIVEAVEKDKQVSELKTPKPPIKPVLVKAKIRNIKKKKGGKVR